MPKATRKPVAAMVSAEDLQLLEHLENSMDLKAARAALKEPGRTPWRQAKKELGRAALATTTQGRTSLAKYDPQKGVKKIAVLEMAEKHFASAKDATRLEKAIRDKLEAQADFVYWWDSRDKHKGGRPSKTNNRSVISLPDQELAETLGTSLMRISRWRKKLNDPNAFEATYQASIARYPKILEFETTAHVGQNTGEYEWYTPPEYIEAARLVLGEIDLDPASTDTANQVVKAAQIFTKDDDALTQSWDGCVWMNPPYSQPLITQFCKKLAESVRAGSIGAAVILVNNATETEWFRALADVAAAICFPSGRVRFWSPTRATATPLQGQAVLYIGDRIDDFCVAFGEFGFLAVVRR